MGPKIDNIKSPEPLNSADSLDYDCTELLFAFIGYIYYIYYIYILYYTILNYQMSIFSKHLFTPWKSPKKY